MVLRCWIHSSILNSINSQQASVIFGSTIGSSGGKDSDSTYVSHQSRDTVDLPSNTLDGAAVVDGLQVLLGSGISEHWTSEHWTCEHWTSATANKRWIRVRFSSLKAC